MNAAAWCQSLFHRCLEYLLIAKLVFLWLGFIAVAVWFIYAILKAIFTLIRTHIQIRNLPLVRHQDIIVIKNDKLKTAFTHGLFYPKIYLSSGLISSLDRSELQAVYLHELHHKNRRDPLRFLFLSIIKDMFFYIPISMYIENIVCNKIEHEADKAVLNKMKEPISLASAILKTIGFNKDISIIPSASIHGVGSIEERVRRLIEGKENKLELPAIKTTIISVCISAFLLIFLAAPLSASSLKIRQCNTKHCAIHIDKLGEDCQKHCKDLKHKHLKQKEEI